MWRLSPSHAHARQKRAGSPYAGRVKERQLRFARWLRGERSLAWEGCFVCCGRSGSIPILHQRTEIGIIRLAVAVNRRQRIATTNPQTSRSLVSMLCCSTVPTM